MKKNYTTMKWLWGTVKNSIFKDKDGKIDPERIAKAVIEGLIAFITALSVSSCTIQTLRLN